MQSIDCVAIIISTVDLEDEIERQYEIFAAVAAVAVAIAAAAADDDNVAALDAAAAVAILSWKCLAKTNKAFKNTRARNNSLAPSFAMLVKVAIAILS